MISINFTRDEWLSLKTKNPEIYSLLNTVRSNEQSLDYCKTLDREKLKRECELGYFDITELFTKEQIMNANSDFFQPSCEGVDFRVVIPRMDVSPRTVCDTAKQRLNYSGNLKRLVESGDSFLINLSGLNGSDFLVLQVMLFKLGVELFGENCNRVNTKSGMNVLRVENKCITMLIRTESAYATFLYDYDTDSITSLKK